MYVRKQSNNTSRGLINQPVKFSHSFGVAFLVFGINLTASCDAA